jgi:hypothetical protein
MVMRFRSKTNKRSGLMRLRTTQSVPLGTPKGRYMARALLGHISSGTDQALALEIGRLRRRVAVLEAELVELREARSVVPASLEIELHQLAEHASPALA